MQDVRREKRDRGVFATKEGVDKLKDAIAAKRNHKDKPWTYADIAFAAGLDDKTVGRFLRQEQGVDEKSARAICQALGVDANEVIDKDRRGLLYPDEPNHKQVIRLVITLDGMDFEKFLDDKEMQDAVKLLFQKASGDKSIKFEIIEKGSIKITLDGSPEGLKRLAALIQSGELGELRELEELGLSIEDANLVVKDATEKNKGADDSNATQADIENLKSAFTETLNQDSTEINNKSRLIEEIPERQISYSGNLAVKAIDNLETYINHPTWGLLYRVCAVEQDQELFTTLYAQRLFFLVTIEPRGLKFQSIGRTEARMMLENRLRNLRRTGQSQEYDQLQSVFKLTFQ